MRGACLNADLKVRLTYPGSDTGGNEHAKHKHRVRIDAKLVGDGCPKHKTRRCDGYAADQAGPAGFNGHPRLVHSAATEMWPARTSSVVFRTRFKSRLTCDASYPLKTCFSSPQARSEVPKNQSATG